MHNDELWQEYDRTGTPIGHGSTPKEFDDSRDSGKARICGAVHVWLFRDTKNGRELLFQKRSLSVKHNPGLWDISAAGHINAGESNLDACVREAREEIGAEVISNNLNFAFSHYAPKQHTFHNVYTYKWTSSVTFHFDDGEVDATEWVPISNAPTFVKENVKHSISSLAWYWEKLLYNLENL